MTVAVFTTSGPVEVKAGDVMAFTHAQPARGKPARVELVRADGSRVPLVSHLVAES